MINWYSLAVPANQDELVRPELLELEQRPLSALARDPETQVLRDGSRLNRVMITRIDPQKLTARYQANAAEGVIAYSAVCTHTGCDVINWDAGQLRMACPCHESQFDIYDGANVVGGPAPRPLAMLPLEVVEHALKLCGVVGGHRRAVRRGAAEPKGGIGAPPDPPLESCATSG